MSSKIILSDDQLREGIQRRRDAEYSKLDIVKYVYENSNKGLKDSHMFVTMN